MEERTKMISFMFFSHHSGRYVEKREKIDDGHTSNKQESGQSFLLSVSSKKNCLDVCVCDSCCLESSVLFFSFLLVDSGEEEEEEKAMDDDE